VSFPTLPATRKLIDPWGRKPGYVWIRVFPFFAANTRLAQSHDIAQFYLEGGETRVRGYLKEDVGEGVVGFRVGVHYSFPKEKSSGWLLKDISDAVSLPGSDRFDIFTVAWEYETSDDYTLTLGNPWVKREFTTSRLSYDARVSATTSPKARVTLQVVVTGPSITASSSDGGGFDLKVVNTSDSTTVQDSPDVNTLDTDPLEIELPLPLAGDYDLHRLIDEDLFRYTVEFDTGRNVPPVKKQPLFDDWLRKVKADPVLGKFVEPLPDSKDPPLLNFGVEGRASELGTYQGNVLLSTQRRDWAVKRIRDFVSSKQDPNGSAIGVPPGAKKGANQADQVAIVTLDQQRAYQLQEAAKPKRAKRR